MLLVEIRFLRSTIDHVETQKDKETAEDRTEENLLECLYVQIWPARPVWADLPEKTHVNCDTSRAGTIIVQ